MRIIIQFNPEEWTRREAAREHVTDANYLEPDKTALPAAGRAYRAARRIPEGPDTIEAVDIADPSGRILYTPIGEEV